jgi:hypothetical protein
MKILIHPIFIVQEAPLEMLLGFNLNPGHNHLSGLDALERMV